MALVFAATLSVCAQFSLNRDFDPVLRVSAFWSATGVKPGGDIGLALVLDIRKPYHINPDKTKEGFIPTTVEVSDAPKELIASTPVFPRPELIDFGTGAAKERIPVFTGTNVLFIPMAVNGAAKPGEHELKINVRYQACDDKQCLQPATSTTSIRLTVTETSGKVEPSNADLFAEFERLKDRLNIAFFGWDFEIRPSNFILLLLIAVVGGFLLNLTPCVLPLIPIKIMSLSRAAGNRARCFALGLAMSAGVVAFWLALAAAISTIKGFDSTNTLFQYPAFTIGVGAVISAMAIGMCGLFSVRLPQWIYVLNPSQETAGGSFLFGILSAILSTPCTAPFMGAAAAWSATQKPAITLTTFAAIGLGMALPYLGLSAFPVLVNRMPRAGPASELIKQVMGLLLLAAGVYFLGTGLAAVLARPPDPPTQAYWWLVAVFIGAAGVWLAVRTFQLTPKAGRRMVVGLVGLGLLAAAVGIGVRFTRRSPVHWIHYTPERLADAQKQAKIVVLEFTAAWCLNCHALEQAVLHDPRVVPLLNDPAVAPVKVDITGNNPAGNDKLIETGRRTIPFLVVYAPDGKVLFSSDAYTVDQLVTILERAKAGR